MVIGILTLALHTNYGGILQAYALQTIIKRMGHEVCHIKSLKKQPNLSFIYLRYLSRFFRKIFQDKNIEVFIERNEERRLIDICKNTKEFIENNICQFEVQNLDSIRNTDFDVLIVGSDQIWRPHYFKDNYFCGIENAFFSFTENWDIKRIAYGASFGTDKWEYTDKETILCKKAINRFDSISVREKSGILLCKEKFNVDSRFVLDPTFLLEKEYYIKLIRNKDKIYSNKDLMCYVLDDNPGITELIQSISNRFGFIPFKASADVSNTRLAKEKRVQPSVESWLQGFNQAKLVITDSFHACVFSIIFHKPFIVIGNKNRGYSRFESLLGIFGLSNRLIAHPSEFKEDLLQDLPSSVYITLDKLKQSSLSFLKNSLD